MYRVRIFTEIKIIVFKNFNIFELVRNFDVKYIMSSQISRECFNFCAAKKFWRQI